MNKSAIRDTLNNYLNKYQETSATVKSFEVVYNFVNYLKSDHYIKKVINTSIVKAEKQTSEMISALESGIYDEIESPNINRVIDIKELQNFSFIDQEEMAKALEMVKNNEVGNIANHVDVSLVNLFFVNKMVEMIKEREADKELTDEMLMALREIPTMLCRFKINDNLIANAITSNIIGRCIWVVSKRIVDEIDTEELFEKSKQKKEPWFDEEKTTLHIAGKEIKIAKKHNLSTAHHLLKALFKQKDISKEIYFKDIAEELLGLSVIGKEYNSKTDWNRYRNACVRLNQDIKDKTDGKIENFIILHTGKSSSCNINKKYL